MEKTMISEEAMMVFRKLKEKYKRHSAVAKKLRIPDRTYRHWRTKGFADEQKWDRIIDFLKQAL